MQSFVLIVITTLNNCSGGLATSLEYFGHGGETAAALAGGVRPAGTDGSGHFSPALLYTAAKMYYTDEATQAEVAEHLHTSRATISRLLYEARRQGIVRIEVIPTDNEVAPDLAARVAAVLGLTAVYISDPLPVQCRQDHRGRDGRLPGRSGGTCAVGGGS